MIEENSGKIYQFKLEHNFGFAYCELTDFTDITKFSGKLVSVFSFIESKVHANPDIEQIVHSPLLFGPHPLLKFPNIKGKGAWKFIGKLKKISIPNIIFKDVRDNHTNKDWTKLKGWHRVKDFEVVGEDCDYEEVRNLELPVLYGMKEIEMRTTMQLLLMNKKSIKDYYDLRDFHVRNIYIQTVNTSFCLSDANKYLNEID